MKQLMYLKIYWYLCKLILCGYSNIISRKLKGLSFIIRSLQKVTENIKEFEEMKILLSLEALNSMFGEILFNTELQS